MHAAEGIYLATDSSLHPLGRCSATPTKDLVRVMSLGKPTIAVGAKFPSDVVVHVGFAGNTPSAPQTVGSLVAGKKILFVTLPGAFTPT